MLDTCVLAHYDYHMKNKQKFAIALRQARLERGWSQERLARALGVSKYTIHRWEKGICMPTSQAIIKRIKAVLGGRVFQEVN